MYTKKYSLPFVAELKPSKKLRQLCILIHALALAASFANAFPLYLKLLLSMLITLNFTIQYKRLKIENHSIKYTEARGWAMSEGQEFTAVEILKSTVVTTLFIFLHMQNKPPLLIANDSLAEHEYRQLIVKLKMTAHEQSQQH
ncbi:MAG: protein YgfX [Methyloglobulus sp.]|nr:hypothetical protein [Methyloglobulus sp.]